MHQVRSANSPSEHKITISCYEFQELIAPDASLALRDQPGLALPIHVN